MAEGGYENVKDPFDQYGLDDNGYDKDGYDKYGYDENGYDKNGYDTYGHDKDGNLFLQEKGEENYPLLVTRTSTSNTRETQRPFKPRVRTSTEREVSFANPSYHVTDGDEKETSFGWIREGVPNVDEHNDNLREQVKKYHPYMDDAAIEVGQNIKGYLSVRLFGSNDRWSPVVDLKGNFFIQFSEELKKALGFNKEKIIKRNKKRNLEARERIGVKKEFLNKDDISEEVKNTTIKEIEEEEEEIETRNQEIEEIKENELIQNQTLLKERIKEIFKKHGFTIGSVVTAVGVVIGVIVSKLTSGLSNMAKSVGNGLKDIGKKLAQILPGMIGAIASFIFKTAGEVLGFLAENAWILVVAVVVYLVENLKKKSKR